MIYTLTLNPAIDYILFVDQVKTGTISKAYKDVACFGGKGINVSLVLKELGVSSVAMGFIAGFTGKAIAEGIACEHIKSDFVELPDGLSRINVKIRAGEETDINVDGPSIALSDIEKLFLKLDALRNGDILVLAGSIPNSLSDDIYEIIMNRLSGKNIRFVVDAQKDLLLNSLKYKPFFIKPNHEELGEIFGVEITTPQMALEYAKKLQNMGAANVLVSLGSQGAVLLDENGNEYYEKALSGKAINTVGAGDSMVAGFLAGYLKTNDYSYALRLGAVTGSVTAFSEGLATWNDIAKYIN